MSARVLAAVAYLMAIVTANIATAHFGMVHVLPGMLVTAGTYAAGAALLARDFVQDTGGRRLVVALIAVGGVMSWFMATPALAVASVAAFTVAELSDMAVYTPLRTKGWGRAATVSGFVGAVVDTLVFLWIAGFPVTVPVVTGQLVGKVLWATIVPVAAVVVIRRAVLREPFVGSGA